MKRKWLIWLGVVVLMGVVAFALFPNPEERRLRAPERKEWKKQALAQVSATSGNTQLISNTITALRAEAEKNPDEGWLGTNLVLMTNGEYLVYSHIDAKQDRRIHDLFLARGSDGKWYYSTFHFCINMITLRMGFMGEGATGSIQEFTNAYALREFDGKSNECLKKTWPFKGWQEKMDGRAR